MSQNTESAINQDDYISRLFRHAVDMERRNHGLLLGVVKEQDDESFEKALREFQAGFEGDGKSLRENEGYSKYLTDAFLQLGAEKDVSADHNLYRNPERAKAIIDCLAAVDAKNALQKIVDQRDGSYGKSKSFLIAYARRKLDSLA